MKLDFSHFSCITKKNLWFYKHETTTQISHGKHGTCICKQFDKQRGVLRTTHRETFSESGSIKQNLDCNYTFPIDLIWNRVQIGAESIRKFKVYYPETDYPCVTVFILNWYRTDVRQVSNQTEKCNYNINLFFFNKIRNRISLCWLLPPEMSINNSVHC